MVYIKSYKELIVWQRSIQLVQEIYTLTAKFPKTELYGISVQMRRSVVSIPSNIAEGFGRTSTKEYRQSYSIAYGSALELETQLLISKKLQFLTLVEFSQCEKLLEEVLKMLNKMVNTLRVKIINQTITRH